MRSRSSGHVFGLPSSECVSSIIDIRTIAPMPRSGPRVPDLRRDLPDLVSVESVNQRLPSGPASMPCGLALPVGEVRATGSFEQLFPRAWCDSDR
jgi:hypothetical protein